MPTISIIGTRAFRDGQLWPRNLVALAIQTCLLSSERTGQCGKPHLVSAATAAAAAAAAVAARAGWQLMSWLREPHVQDGWAAPLAACRWERLCRAGLVAAAGLARASYIIM